MLQSPERRPVRCGGITVMQVADEGACVEERDGRVAILQHGREVWRSHGSYRISGVFAKLGPHAVAFSYDTYGQRRPTQTLLMARLDGSERVVAHNERPLGWTRTGELLTWRIHKGATAVYLRAPTTPTPRLVAAGLAEIRWHPTTQTLFMLSRRGVVSRYDGGRQERLADVRGLGFDRRPALELLDGQLVALLGRSRIAVLHDDGSVFANVFLRPEANRYSLAGTSGLVANHAGTEVAFTLTEGNDGYRSLGRESVYILRPGAQQASRVYSHQLRFALCERWANLSWHGSWLLYAAIEGHTIALNTAPPHQRVALTTITGELGRFDGHGQTDVRVHWANAH
jgi:hypothetical protein